MNRELAGRRGQCVANFSPTPIQLPHLFLFLTELTFIVLARPLEPSSPAGLELTDDDIRALPMIGDVNLFFKNQREDPEFEVECEVMIAGSWPFTRFKNGMPCHLHL
jgi:hypothetical protein